ncbi:hypothetical protein GCM10028775_22620 [Catellatospora paridis]
MNVTPAQMVANMKRAKYSRRRAAAAVEMAGEATWVILIFSVVMVVLSVVSKEGATSGFARDRWGRPNVPSL